MLHYAYDHIDVHFKNHEILRWTCEIGLGTDRRESILDLFLTSHDTSNYLSPRRVSQRFAFYYGKISSWIYARDAKEFSAFMLLEYDRLVINAKIEFLVRVAVKVEAWNMYSEI